MSFGASAFGEVPFGALAVEVGALQGAGAAEGNAFTTGTAKLTHAARGAAEANAFTAGRAKQTHAAVGSAEANAFTVGFMARILDAVGDVAEAQDRKSVA